MADLPVHAPRIYIGDDAVGALIDYAREQELRLTLVADANTYQALARRVEEQAAALGLDVITVVAKGPEPIVSDERRLVQVLIDAGASERAYVAVGSGTVTDITRFASFHARNRFISMPTAASMDGYATSNNTLSVAGLKISVPRPPARGNLLRLAHAWGRAQGNERGRAGRHPRQVHLR